MTVTRAESMRALIEAHGLHIKPFGGAGAVLVHGHGVYVLADHVEALVPADLVPVDDAEISQRAQR